MKSPPVSVLLQTQHNLLLLQRPTVRHGRTNWRWRCQGLYLSPTNTTTTNHRHFLRILTYYPPQIRMNGENFLLSPSTTYTKCILSCHFLAPSSYSRSFVQCWVASSLEKLSIYLHFGNHQLCTRLHRHSPCCCSLSSLSYLFPSQIIIIISSNLLSSTFSALPSSLKCNGRHLRLGESLERHEDRCTFE